MPELVIPRHCFAGSVRDAARESGSDEHPDYGTSVAALTDDELIAYVERLLGDTREHAPRPTGWVPSTHLWWVDGATYLGRVQIRHRLTPVLREVGGHLGYYVLPAHRRLGHATAMLAATVPVAAALGIECLLITCDVDNIGSRKVIEANGGLFAGRRADKLRFWVPTA